MLFAKRLVLCAPLLALLAIVVGLPNVAFGDTDARTFSARFLGVNETPSINTDATASLHVTINGSGNNATIDYTLTFSGLTTQVTQAHIHFAQERVAGAIVVFLCKTTQTNAPAGTPDCGSGTSGMVTGTLTSANVTALAAAQGIPAGDMAGLVKAIRQGAAYGNVHSTTFPAGETRGQLRPTDLDHG